MTSTTISNGTRLRSYEEIVAAESDTVLRIVQFASTDRLTATVEEYEEKASLFEGSTGDLMFHIAELGREELEKRDALYSRKVIR